MESSFSGDICFGTALFYQAPVAFATAASAADAQNGNSSGKPILEQAAGRIMGLAIIPGLSYNKSAGHIQATPHNGSALLRYAVLPLQFYVRKGETPCILKRF